MSIASRLAMTACACAALASTGTAQASATAYGELSNFTVTLYDLEPDDGIDPSFTLLTNLGGTTISGVGSFIFSPAALEMGFEQLDAAQMQFGAPGSALSRSAAVADAQIESTAGNGVYTVFTTVNQGATGSGFYMGASGLATGGIYDETVGSRTPGLQPLGMTSAVLSANTGVVIEADVHLQLGALMDCENCASEAHVVAGSLGLSVGDRFFSGGNILDQAVLQYTQTSEDPLLENYNQSLDQRLRIEYANFDLVETQTLQVLAGVNVAGAWQAGAIPEPGTCALVGIGLGAAAWQARRRQRAAS